MRLLLVSLVTLIAAGACGKPEAPQPAPAASAGETLSPLNESSPEDDAAGGGVAVNEPLPPFEDDSGIVLASKAKLRPLDAALGISGEVLLYQAPDGSRLLRLQDFNSPKELHIDVALSRSANPVGADDVQYALPVGPLKGPSGNMNFLLESGAIYEGVRSLMLIEHTQRRVLALAPLNGPN